VTRVVARAAFFVIALPAIARAALRVRRLERRYGIEDSVDRLRGVPPFAIRLLCNPWWLLAVVDRLLPVLPPRGYGRCLKRSLLLLDLWARCGLRPRLHLGVRRADQTAHEGHAWVTVEVDGGGVGPATSSLGYPEAFRF
jgi:hypothetical protein